MKNYKNAAIRNQNYYFLPHLTWTKITSSRISFRYRPQGSLFSDAGCAAVFNGDMLWYALGLLNSSYAQLIFNIINPTINYTQNTIASLPLCYTQKDIVIPITKQNVKLAKDDWDAFEISWDFKELPNHRS